VALLGVISAEVSIIKPDALRAAFNDEDIPAVYANFGRIPYGQSIVSY
jgi:hypothetical protein